MKAHEYLDKHSNGIPETRFMEMCIHRLEYPLLEQWIDNQKDVYFHEQNKPFCTGEYNCFRLRLIEKGGEVAGTLVGGNYRYFLEYLSTGESPEELRKAARRLGYFKPGMYPILLKDITTVVPLVELDF